MDVNLLEELIMDLVQKEMEIISKSKETKVNFNLCKFRGIFLYTKWKRKLIKDDERKGIFKDIDTKKMR